MHAHGGAAFGGFAIEHEGRDEGAHQHIQRHAAIGPGGLGAFQSPAPRCRDLFRPAHIGSAKQIPLGPEVIMELRQIDPGGERNGAGRGARIAMIGKQHLRHIQDAVADTGRRINRGKQAGHGLRAFGRVTNVANLGRFAPRATRKPEIDRNHPRRYLVRRLIYTGP